MRSPEPRAPGAKARRGASRGPTTKSSDCTATSPPRGGASTRRLCPSLRQRRESSSGSATPGLAAAAVGEIHTMVSSRRGTRGGGRTINGSRRGLRGFAWLGARLLPRGTFLRCLNLADEGSPASKCAHLRARPRNTFNTRTAHLVKRSFVVLWIRLLPFSARKTFRLLYSRNSAASRSSYTPRYLIV